MFLSFFAVLLAAGCKKESLTPVIRAVAVEIGKDAGEYSLDYSVENAESGKSLTAETDADWIYDIRVEGSKVVFMAEQNTGASRSADMRLSYPGAAGLTVKVNQGSVFEGAFKIEVKDITPYGCTVVYTPVEYSGNYIFFVMEKESVMPYLLDAGGLDDLYRGDVSYVQSIADANGLTLEECLQRLPQLYTMDGKATEMSYTDLDFNTDYIAYCYGLSLDGKRLTDFVMAEFSTGIVTSSDITFEASVSNIGQNSAEILVTPSNSDYYYWTYVSEMDYSQYSLEEIMINMINNIMEYVDSWGEPITTFIHSGESSDAPEDLWSGTNYYIVAWGMDLNGNPTTLPVEVASFKTESEPVTDDCTFQVTVLETRAEDIKVRVEPSKDNTMYYVGMVEESRCTGYSDRQMAQRIVNMEASRLEDGSYYDDNTWESITHTGTTELWGNRDLYWNFLPEHTYRIYVFGVSTDGQITTEVKRVDQTTEPAVTSDMTIETRLVSSTWNYGTFEFTPSNDDEYYLPFILETADAEIYKKADGSYDEIALMEEIEHYYEDEIIYKRMRGRKTYECYWKSDTDYTMLVFGYSGTNTTQFFEFKTHSPEIPFEKSDAEVSADYCFIDGNELAAKYPDQWDADDVKDACIMVTKFTPNAAAEHWYGGVWGTVDQYEYGVDHLMALIRNDSAPANCIDDYQTTCRPWYNYKWSFSYVAEGADGNFGKWHYIEFTPTVDDTVEPYDFWSNPYNGSAATAVYSIPKTTFETPKDITQKVFSPAAHGSRPASKKATDKLTREL